MLVFISVILTYEFFFDCPRLNNDVIWHFISRSSLSLTAPPICSVVLHKQTDTIDMYKIDFQNYVVFLYITLVESISLFLYEPHHEKTGFLHMRNKGADQLCRRIV